MAARLAILQIKEGHKKEKEAWQKIFLWIYSRSVAANVCSFSHTLAHKRDSYNVLFL